MSDECHFYTLPQVGSDEDAISSSDESDLEVTSSVDEANGDIGQTDVDFDFDLDLGDDDEESER